jgi:phage terminase small subunit
MTRSDSTTTDAGRGIPFLHDYNTLIRLGSMPTLKNQREELFAHEVAAFTEIGRAYLLAGYQSRPEFARANACRLMRKTRVQDRIDELRAEFRKHCALNLEYLQETLRPIVDADMAEFVTAKDDGAEAQGRQRFKDFAELGRRQGLAVSSVKLGDNGEIVELKLHNKIEAAKALMVSLGMRDAEHGQNAAARSLGDRLNSALARLAGGPAVLGSSQASGSVIDGQVVDGEMIIL